MVKPEWGTKRTCPKCATRFYDLGKEDPVTCINCGAAWNAEPILKSKQPLPYEAAKVADPVTKKAKDSDLGDDDEDDVEDDDDDDLDIDEEDNDSPDDEVDLGGDDDLGVEPVKDDDDN